MVYHWSQSWLRRICQSFASMAPGGSPLREWFQVVSMSFRWYLNHKIAGAICSPQAGLHHTHCPFSVDDGVAPASHSLWEWSVSTMPSLQVITDVQMRGLTEPHMWKWSILSQFHKGYVIHVWLFRCGQELRKWEYRKWSASCEWGNFPMLHCYAIQKVKP